MPLRIEGDFGAMIFSGATTDDGEKTTNYLSLNTQASLNFFRKSAIIKPDLTNNFFGLYSYASAGRSDKVRFANLTLPKHLLSKRKSGCSWNPKGRINMNTDEISLCAVEYNGEQCPDAFWESCMERIFGTGNSVRDLMATPEGKAIAGELINRIYLGLGNSVYDLAWFGQHPMIDDSDTNDWWTGSDQDWADFVDQQDACGGWMTIIDQFKSDGVENYDVTIAPGDIDGSDNTLYTGDAIALFNSMIKAAPPVLSIMLKSSRVGNRVPVILVTRSIFDAYEEQLLTQHNSIPQSFYYQYTGEFCKANGCLPGESMRGVLYYKGHAVVCMDEWSMFDQITGTVTHRALLAAPGVLGLAYDVPTLAQFSGLGLRLTQRLDPPFQGKLYMDTTFKMGTSIIDPNYMVNASITLTP